MEVEGLRPPRNSQHFSGSNPFKTQHRNRFYAFHFGKPLRLALVMILTVTRFTCRTHRPEKLVPILFVDKTMWWCQL